MTSKLVAVLTALLILAAVPTRADENPPAPAETCTLDAARRSGETCLVCGAWDGDAAKCLKHLSPQGYQLRCKTVPTPTAGKTTWSEVWCRAERTPPK